MASDNSTSTGGIGLVGVAVAAPIVAAFAYFLIGNRLGLRDAVSDADVRVEAARIPIPLPEPRQRK